MSSVDDLAQELQKTYDELGGRENKVLAKLIFGINNREKWRGISDKQRRVIVLRVFGNESFNVISLGAKLALHLDKIRR